MQRSHSDHHMLCSTQPQDQIVLLLLKERLWSSVPHKPSLLMADSVCLFLFSVKASYLDQDRTRWNNDHVGHEVLKKMFLHNWPHVGSGRYYERHAGSESAVAVFLSQTWISKHSMLLLTFQSAFELLQHNNYLVAVCRAAYSCGVTLEDLKGCYSIQTHPLWSLCQLTECAKIHKKKSLPGFLLLAVRICRFSFCLRW